VEDKSPAAHEAAEAGCQGAASATNFRHNRSDTSFVQNIILALRRRESPHIRPSTRSRGRSILVLPNAAVSRAHPTIASLSAAWPRPDARRFAPSHLSLRRQRLKPQRCRSSMSDNAADGKRRRDNASATTPGG